MKKFEKYHVPDREKVSVVWFNGALLNLRHGSAIECVVSKLLSTHSAATSKGATPSILLYTGQVLYTIPFIGGGGEA